MATKELYGIRFIDFERNNGATLNGFKTADAAANAGWAMLEAIAHNRDLSYENQGDQFMAYYPDGHANAGEGVIIVEIFNEYTGEPYTDL